MLYSDREAAAGSVEPRKESLSRNESVKGRGCDGERDVLDSLKGLSVGSGNKRGKLEFVGE